jgi:hypothetical protein
MKRPSANNRGSRRRDGVSFVSDRICPGAAALCVRPSRASRKKMSHSRKRSLQETGRRRAHHVALQLDLVQMTTSPRRTGSIYRPSRQPYQPSSCRRFLLADLRVLPAQLRWLCPRLGDHGGSFGSDEIMA